MNARLRLFLQSSTFIGFSLLILSGCASLSRDGQTQALLVNSSPPGAHIYSQGEFLGTTPAYVGLISEARPQLEVELPGISEKKQISPDTSYRWKKSFFSNLVFLTLTPIGWAIDFINGSAWEIEPIDEVIFKVPNDYKPEKKKTLKLAIAPPAIGSQDLADEIGFALERLYKNDPSFEVLPYEGTAPLFEYYDSDEELTEDRKQRAHLFYHLGSDAVLFSEVSMKGEGFEVNGKIKDVFHFNDIGTTKETFTSDRNTIQRQLALNKTLGDYFHFLPNTAFVSFAQPSNTLTVNQTAYEAEISRGNTVIDEASQIIERFNLSRLEPPRKNTLGYGSIDFIPDLNVSHSRLSYKDYAALSDFEFSRWLIGVGYGPRLSYISRYGTVYLDITPNLTWSKIKSSGAPNNTDKSRSSITLSAEFGYLYFFNKKFIFKLFSRTVSEDVSLWEKTIYDLTGDQVEIDSHSNLFAGISFGYYFGLSSSRDYFKIQKSKR